MSNAISRKIGEAAWRLRAVRFTQLVAWLSAAGLIGLLLWRIAAWNHPALWRGDIVTLAGAVLICSTLAAALSWRNRKAVARELDHRARTHDRFLSFLELRKKADLPAIPLIERDVTAFSEKLSLAGLFRPRFPVLPIACALAAAVGLVVLEQFHKHRKDALASEQAEATRLIEKAKAVVDQHATEDPEIAALKEELQKEWQKLADSTQPKRDAFRALSNLEKQLANAAQAAALSGEEKDALAQALAGENGKVSEALQKGTGDEAAQQIASLDPEALAEALQEAARHRESNRLRDLTRQPATQAQQTLVRSLNSSSAAQRMQQALREAKAGENSQDSGQGQKTAEQGAPTDAPPGNEKGQSGQLSQAPPGGVPGSDKDQGTGKDIKDERERLSGSNSQDDLLNSLTSGGPSRVASTELAGDGPGQAQRAKRAIDQAAIAAALQEVEQENIPPGSQVLVRRYFESIRPKE